MTNITIMDEMQRKTDLLFKLKDLQEKYAINLSKCYNSDSDVNEMEFEYHLQLHRIRNKEINNIHGLIMTGIRLIAANKKIEEKNSTK